MWVFVTVVHVIVSIFIIFVILLQPGKSDGMAAFAGGGGGSQTVFGGSGAVTFLAKLPSQSGPVFMRTFLPLAYHPSHSPPSPPRPRNPPPTHPTPHLTPPPHP